MLFDRLGSRRETVRRPAHERKNKTKQKEEKKEEKRGKKKVYDAARAGLLPGS